MIPGANTSPYRLPCSGATLCSNGPLYQHARASEKNIPVYLYNGKVPNWQSGSPSTIIPYERFNAANPCSGVSNCSGTAACWTAPDYPSAPPCLPWSGTDPCQYALPSDWPNFWYQPQMLTAASVSDGGENYQLGDVLSAAGGTLSTYIGEGSGASTVTVAKVNSSGAITAVTLTNTGSYQTNPASPNTMTGGHGTGASITLTFGNQTMSFANCFDYGYKNVQAMRQWHGQRGYFFNGQVGVYECIGYTDDETSYANNYNAYEPFLSTASQTKYLSLDYSVVNSTVVDDGSCVYTSDTEAASLSVDSTSGVITVASFTASNPCVDCVSPASDFLYLIAYGPQDWLNFFFTAAAALPTTIEYAYTDCVTATFSDDGYSITVQCPDESPTSDVTVSWTIGTDSLYATATFHTYGSAFESDFTGTVTEIQTLTLTDDSLSYSDAIDYDGAPGYPSSTLLSVSATLSNVNSSSDVLSDINTLLDEWDLTDDNQYPWRTDDYTSIAPIVTRNEVGANVGLIGATTHVNGDPIDDCSGNDPSNPSWTPTYEQITAVDPNAAICDGSILGSPMPAGYQGFFDFNYQDYQVCDSTDPITLYFNGWGQYNAGQNGIPLNATQWTNNQLAIQFCPGAWIFYNHNPSWISCAGLPDGYEYYPGVICIAQKWAETKMGFPSQNFSRPAGSDRFLYDETNVYNISAISGSGVGAQITLEQTASCAAATLSSTSGLWGGTAVGGFYEIASASGNVITLGTLIYSVPSNWTSSAAASTVGTDENYCFGFLRWSTGDTDTDPPAIMGRASVISIAEYETHAGVTELTTNSLPTLGLGQTESDYVDIYDSLMNLLSGNLEVTRLTDTTFTVPVAVSSLTGAAWIMTTGAPGYFWNDQYPKGDYAYTEWTWWPRQICEASRINSINADCETNSCTNCPGTETVDSYPFRAFSQTADCLPFNPCSPSVICFSPNDDDFDNGNTYDFPTINFDEIWGSGWQAQPQQIMEDLYFQSPHVPAQGPDCSGGAYAWNSDDGSCETSGGSPLIEYFAHAPMVECRLTVPDDAPALTQPVNNVETCGTNEIVIGWSSPVGILSGDCVPSTTLFPPTSNGIGFTSFNAWDLWSNECGCIAASGEFSSQYQNQVIACA